MEWRDVPRMNSRVGSGEFIRRTGSQRRFYRPTRVQTKFNAGTPRAIPDYFAFASKSAQNVAAGRAP